MTDVFSIQFSGNIEAGRTEARISQRSAQTGDVLIAVVYEGSQGFVVSYFGLALVNPSLPGLEAAIAEARGELLHYVNRRGENRPQGITRAGLSLWLTERDDETVIGMPFK
jgi:hypothetical protein